MVLGYRENDGEPESRCTVATATNSQLNPTSKAGNRVGFQIYVGVVELGVGPQESGVGECAVRSPVAKMSEAWREKRREAKSKR